MNSKKYYLTPNEFSVVSAGFGLSMVYGLKQIDGKVDNKEICMALHNMYVNELIENKNDQGFTTDDEMADMMKRIKSSNRVMVIEFSEEKNVHTICCYCGEHADKDLIVEENCSNPDKIILYFADWDEMQDNILDMTVGKAVTVGILDTKDGRILEREELDATLQDFDKKTVLVRYRKEGIQI